MKKLLKVVLAAVMAFTLVACGGGGSVVATVTRPDGTQEQMTAEDLRKIYDENSANFYKNYQMATLEFTTEVISVDYLQSSIGTMVYRIECEGGFEVEVVASLHDEVIDFAKGDKIEVTTEIQSCFGDTVECFDIGKSGGEWIDGTTIKVVK